MEIKPAVIGRPEKYTTHVQPRLKEIYSWVQRGATERSIADSLGLGESTLYDYKKTYKELGDVYARARLERTALVMNSMYSRAIGTVTTVKQEKLTRGGNVIVLNSEIFTPADVNAADLFLRNNDPSYIQPRQESSGSITVNVQLPQVQAELDKLAGKRAALELELATIEAVVIEERTGSDGSDGSPGSDEEPEPFM